MILGIDAGGYETKVCTANGSYKFLSTIGEYRDRKWNDSFSKDDMIWEYEGEKGFAGSLAFFESDFGGNIRGNSKFHKDAKIRILLAVYRFGSFNNKIIVGQPIDTHVEDEKQGIREMLLGSHAVSINGRTKEFSIDRIEIAPEGPSGALSQTMPEGLVRIIDIGSGTTNYASLHNYRRIDKGSFTDMTGMETTKTKDPEKMALKIYRTISSYWDKNDTIFISGGGAVKVFDHLIQYLPNCQLIRPCISDKNGQLTSLTPEFANAAGFYALAERLFSND